MRLHESRPKVTYEVGSGHRGRSYLIERDGRLFQSPISWYSQQGRWDLSPDSLVKNNHFERAIDSSCVFCHANRFDPVVGTINRYKSPTFQGLAIGCERCHGPGALHVRNPGVLSDGRDLTIVNPAHLEPVLRESVCEQCHLGGRSRVERLDRTALDFRPGLPLHEFLAVFVSGEQHSGTVKSIGHVEQMHASRCYRGSSGQLGCTSCHDPHRLPPPEERTTYYRNRCLECHAVGAGCSLPESTRRQRSPDDSCIECHMPRSALSNVAHTAETDHAFRAARTRQNRSRSSPVPRRRTSHLWFPSPKSSRPPEGASWIANSGIALIGLWYAADAWPGPTGPVGAAAARCEPEGAPGRSGRLAVQDRRPHLAQPDQRGDLRRGVCLALDPDDERTLDLTIPLLATVGRRKEALALCQRLLALQPLGLRVSPRDGDDSTLNFASGARRPSLARPHSALIPVI